MTIPGRSELRKAKRGRGIGRVVVPDVAGMSLGKAALAYAACGWYLLPTDPTDIKNPGSVVHGKWHEQSCSDAEQIREWWTDNPNYGIALHCGRSGLMAFDLDIDHLGQITREGFPEIAEALRSAGAIHLTRREGDRGHYLFLTNGEEFGNSAGLFMRWGQVRGKNGVIILAPTPHPDAETKGGHYHWKRLPS